MNDRVRIIKYEWMNIRMIWMNGNEENVNSWRLLMGTQKPRIEVLMKILVY